MSQALGMYSMLNLLLGTDKLQAKQSSCYKKGIRF